MSLPVTIRLAAPERDAQGVAAIYAPHVLVSVASFELEPPDAAVMAERIRRNLAWAPWLVAVSDEDVVGYAYAVRHRERAGYRWAVDLSVYVAESRQGERIGRRLYEALVQILRLQGFQHAYAGITPPNPASFALHAAIGMTLVGTYQRVGYKFGAWWSVTWLGVQLSDALPDTPAEPTAMPDLLATDEGRSAVEGILSGSTADPGS
jgi:L-amino acid N-acyltransferase YncA